MSRSGSGFHGRKPNKSKSYIILTSEVNEQHKLSEYAI